MSSCTEMHVTSPLHIRYTKARCIKMPQRYFPQRLKNSILFLLTLSWFQGFLRSAMKWLPHITARNQPDVTYLKRRDKWYGILYCLLMYCMGGGCYITNLQVCVPAVSSATNKEPWVDSSSSRTHGIRQSAIGPGFNHCAIMIPFSIHLFTFWGKSSGVLLLIC